ncbi:MAG TPA: ABC transporter substrate binding protein [Methylomirabilota bacterium]|jgi:putative ABC transport system substrate-binding protein
MDAEGPIRSDASTRTRIGQRVRDRYRIVRELGSGVFGTVYLAEDETTAQRVAIRFLPRELAAKPNVVKAVRAQSRPITAGASDHPGLVRVLEFGEAEPGEPFVVMQLVEGRRLSDILSEGTTLDHAAARRWALDLGASVEAIHNMGLIHGRLRPRNVMILPDGSVKLMDVELIGLAEEPAPQSVLDASPAEYLAPEQIRREPVTEKTDIYSLGTIIYEMFCGAPPFRGANRDAIVSRQLTGPPARMGRRRAVPHSTERIVMQALEKDPDQRPWVHEMLNDLWGETKAPATRDWKRLAMIGGGMTFAASLVVVIGAWALLGSRPSVVRATAARGERAPATAPRIASSPASATRAAARVESAVRPATPAAAPSPPPTIAPSAAEPAPAKVSPETVKALPPTAPPPAKVVAVSSATPGSTAAVEVQPHRRTYRVGWLDSGRATAPYQELVKQALVGYPRDVAFEYRSADGQTARLQEFAAELAQLKVDVVFAAGNPAIRAAKRATSTIPIVMVGSDAASDESSTNVTGVTYSSAELARSWLSLLKEIRSPLGRVAVVYGADPGSRADLTSLQTAAANAGVKIQSFALQDGDAPGGLFAAPPAERPDAIIVPGGPSALVQLSRIVDLAGRARVPAIYGSSEFAEAGGLLAYGPSSAAMYRRAGSYIGKILGPTNPRDLPVEHPSRFELVVNLKTARALGLTLPQSLVLRADRVLQ